MTLQFRGMWFSYAEIANIWIANWIEGEIVAGRERRKGGRESEEKEGMIDSELQLTKISLWSSSSCRLMPPSPNISPTRYLKKKMSVISLSTNFSKISISVIFAMRINDSILTKNWGYFVGVLFAVLTSGTI